MTEINKATIIAKTIRLALLTDGERQKQYFLVMLAELLDVDISDIEYGPACTP